MAAAWTFFMVLIATVALVGCRASGAPTSPTLEALPLIVEGVGPIGASRTGGYWVYKSDRTPQSLITALEAEFASLGWRTTVPPVNDPISGGSFFASLDGRCVAVFDPLSQNSVAEVFWEGLSESKRARLVGNELLAVKEISCG